MTSAHGGKRIEFDTVPAIWLVSDSLKRQARVIRSGVSSLVQGQERYVVRVEYGRTKPLQRKWYEVDVEHEQLCELTCAEVQQFGELPWC